MRVSFGVNRSRTQLLLAKAQNRGPRIKCPPNDAPDRSNRDLAGPSMRSPPRSAKAAWVRRSCGCLGSQLAAPSLGRRVRLASQAQLVENTIVEAGKGFALVGRFHSLARRPWPGAARAAASTRRTSRTVARSSLRNLTFPVRRARGTIGCARLTAAPSAPGGDPPPRRARRSPPLSDPSGGSPLGPRRG